MNQNTIDTILVFVCIFLYSIGIYLTILTAEIKNKNKSEKQD